MEGAEYKPSLEGGIGDLFRPLTCTFPMLSRLRFFRLRYRGASTMLNE